MAIRIVPSHAGCPPRAVWSIYDDRRHLYLDREGRWRVVPWYFASPQEAFEALRLKNQRDEFAIR